MKQKKVLYVVLSVVMVLSMLLAGCGPTTDSGTTTTKADTTTVAAATTAEPLDPYEINWVFGGWSVAKDLAMIEEAASTYLADKINASLKITILDWGSYAQKRDLMLAANEKVDICFSAGWCGYFENLPKGVYLDIKDLIDQYAPKTKALISPTLWEGGKFKGGIYGIPCNKEGAQDYGVMYRKDITDKYGIDMSGVKTVTDLEPIYAQIKTSEPDMVVSQSADMEKFFTFEKYAEFGGVNQTVMVDTSNDQFKAISYFETPEVMQAWQLTRKWYEADYVQKDVLTDQEHNNEAQTSGNVFSYFLNLKPYKDAENNIVAVAPIEWKQIDITKAIGTQDAVAGSLMNVPAAAQDPARSIMFLELFNTDKYLNNLINFGIEGVHYKKTGDNRIDYADGVTAETSGYNPQSQWVYGNQFINYLWPSEKDDKWIKYDEYNKNSIPSPIVSFVFDSGPVKNEIAAMVNVNNQYRNSLRFGTVDPTVVGPEFVTKLKESGLQKVIDEVQKQLDAWAAGNK